MKSSLLKRIITAVIIAPLIIWGTLALPTLYFSLILSLVLLLATWEWTRLMELKSMLLRVCYIIFFALLMLLLYYQVILQANQTLQHWLLIVAVCWWLIALYWIFYYSSTSACVSHSKGINGILGFLVIIPCWLGFMSIRISQHGPVLVLYIMFLIAFADIGAYVFGKLFGKHKLIPKVSPGKSIEGVVGGFVFGLAIVALSDGVFQFDIEHWLGWLIMAWIIIIFSIVGDLFISVMKRRCQLKDTGHILPGHGGILDRIDSYTSAIPIFAFFILVMGIR